MGSCQFTILHLAFERLSLMPQDRQFDPRTEMIHAILHECYPCLDKNNGDPWRSVASENDQGNGLASFARCVCKAKKEATLVEAHGK